MNDNRKVKKVLEEQEQNQYKNTFYQKHSSQREKAPLLGKAFSVCFHSTLETKGTAACYHRLYESDYVGHKQHIHIFQTD